MANDICKEVPSQKMTGGSQPEVVMCVIPNDNIADVVVTATERGEEGTAGIKTHERPNSRKYN